jgi:ABC-type dipeptide/oligopeptide/nickel transport system permease subunit
VARPLVRFLALIGGTGLADDRQYLFEAWWTSALPGLAIVLAVLSFTS